MPARAHSPAPARPVPTSGTITVPSRYCECDPMGVVHHASYIPWLEIGRTELLRDTGVTYAELEAAGVFLVIVKLECSYKRPAYYDDLIEVRTRVVGGSRVKIRHEYELFRDDTLSNGTQSATPGLTQRRTPGELLMTAASLLASVDRTGRPAPLPDWLVPA
jgi:acyl-CoA thioester hydrolase